MTTYHTVTANLESLLTPGLRSPVVTVRSNVPASAALVDLDNNKIIVSSDRVQLVDKSTFSISLIDTAGAGTNVPDGSLRWTIQVDYTDARGARKTWICGDFTLTADLDLSDAVATADPPATIANQYLAQMQALIDEAEAITGLTGEDAAVATLVGNPASATRAALSATYATVVAHGSTAGTARPSGATQVLWKGTVSPTNGADGDVWLNTSTGDEKVRVSGSFIALNKANNDATYARARGIWVDDFATPAAAAVALHANGGGQLLFKPNATYTLTAPVLVDGTAPIEIIATGATIIPPTGDTAIKFQTNQSKYLAALRGGKFDGSTVGGAAGTTKGVSIIDSYGVRIDDVSIYQCGTGILVTDSSTWSETTMFDDVYINGAGVGIDLQKGGGTGSCGYSRWGMVHIDSIPANGIGVRWGANVDFHGSTIERLITHTNQAGAIGLDIHGLDFTNCHIMAILEMLGASAPAGSTAVNIDAASNMDGGIFHISALGNWANSINNPSHRPAQIRLSNPGQRKLDTAETAGGVIYYAGLVGDSNARFIQHPDGAQDHGPGNAVQDTTWKRSAAGVMQSSGAIAAVGLTGATASSRYVGATAAGAPTTGTFAVGDFVNDQTGIIWICTGAGTPGTWAALVSTANVTQTIAGTKSFSGTVNLNGTSVTIATALSKAVNTPTSATTLTGSGSSATSRPMQFCDATTAAFAITLPNTSSAGLTFTIKKVDSSANAVTVTPSAGGTIDGGSTYALSSQWSTVTVVSTSTANTWRIISKI